MAPYMDGSHLGPHRMFAKVFRLERFKLEDDQNWNQGKPFVIGEPVRADQIDIDKIYDAGIESHKIGNTYFWKK